MHDTPDQVDWHGPKAGENAGYGKFVTGYVIAACNFSFAHGLASVSKIAVSVPFSIYPALVIQPPRPNGENVNN